jgi:hypothetical protein
MHINNTAARAVVLRAYLPPKDAGGEMHSQVLAFVLASIAMLAAAQAMVDAGDELRVWTRHGNIRAHMESSTDCRLMGDGEEPS